jgi:hypothetical protein
MKESLKINLKESDLDTFLTVSFYYLDEIYQPIKYLTQRPGPKPSFSDIEVITLNVVGQMFTDSEKAWHRFVKKNYLSLFPRLISLSRYHRRSKDLQQLTEIIRQKLVQLLGMDLEAWHLVDSMPIPVCLRVRASRNMRFCEEFNLDNALLYGYCASKKMKIYGFKLHLMVSYQGIPVHYVLAPAAHHDVKVAPDLVETYRDNITIGTDKGYIGLEKKLLRSENFHLVTPLRNNQKKGLNKEEKAFLAKYRKIIETTNSLLSEQLNIQKTRAKSKWGLTNRIIAKITSLTFAAYLNFLTKEPLLNIKELIF